jgi:hypothetical protein
MCSLGAWSGELAENYLSPVFSLCSVLLFSSAVSPWSRDSDLLLDLAVSDTHFLKKKWDLLTDGNGKYHPFFGTARKGSHKRKRVIWAQHVIRFFMIDPGKRTGCQGLYKWPFPAWREKGFSWNFQSAFSDRNQASRNMCHLSRWPGSIFFINPKNSKAVFMIMFDA